MLADGTCDSVSSGLVHPFLTDLREKTVNRYSLWDNEDLDSYMNDVHEDICVRVHVKNEVGSVVVLLIEIKERLAIDYRERD